MSQPRILIVEDERQLVKTLEYNFAREGYETLVAHDGGEGLRKAQTLLPDLVLLDLMLPVMNGLDVCRELRAGEKTREIPIIMLTARAEEPGRAFSRQQLMNASIGDGHVVLERTIDVHVKTLRKKLAKPDSIETVRGVGYRFKEA